MSELCFSPVFEEVTSIVNCQPFSAGYFGRHCGRNLLLLQHNVTLMLVFRDDESSHFTPDFIKSVSSDGVSIKGVQIVGNENIILLLDCTGKLWRLVNAFEPSDEHDQRLYLLDKDCFYEWLSFKKFKFEKTLAISPWRQGFICMGIQKNLQRKLLLLPSVNSNVVKEYTSEEITCSNSLNFQIINLKTNTQDSANCHVKLVEEKLLMNNKLTGKTYICSDNESTLINYSNDILVSVLNFEQENSVLLCFQSGKLVCNFLNFFCDSVVHLPQKLSLIEKCCCSEDCVLWSEGITLHHTKLLFQKCSLKLVHWKLNFRIEKPQWLAKFNKVIIALTLNNIYYQIKVGSGFGEKIERQPEEVLSKIWQGSLAVHKLNSQIKQINNYLFWKEILEKSLLKEKVEMSLEQSCLLLKFSSGMSLSKENWQLMLVGTSAGGKSCVRVADFETDVAEGMVVRIEMGHKVKGRVKVRLIGRLNGGGETLIGDLGEVGHSESNVVSDVGENVKRILVKKRPFLVEPRLQ